MNRPNCWWCNGKLALVANGPRRGELAFRLVKDQVGHEHKVHVCCELSAQADSRQVTAQPSEAPPDQEDG